MTKAETDYIKASQAFIKAKQGKSAAVRAKAKAELHKAREVWREERDGVGTVAPATVSTKAAINNGG